MYPAIIPLSIWTLAREAHVSQSRRPNVHTRFDATEIGLDLQLPDGTMTSADFEETVRN